MEKERLEQLVNIKTGKLNAKYENGINPDSLHVLEETLNVNNILMSGGSRQGDLNAGKYYNGKLDSYQKTNILTRTKIDTRLNLKYLYYLCKGIKETLRNQSIGGVIKSVENYQSEKNLR